jgi:hypothetical protein
MSEDNGREGFLPIETTRKLEHPDGFAFTVEPDGDGLMLVLREWDYNKSRKRPAAEIHLSRYSAKTVADMLIQAANEIEP